MVERGLSRPTGNQTAMGEQAVGAPLGPTVPQRGLGGPATDRRAKGSDEGGGGQRARAKAPWILQAAGTAGWSRRRFWRALAAVTAVGLVWRVIYVVAFTRYENSHIYDAFYYVIESSLLAAGHFFVQPLHGGPDASHPPLTVLVLTPISYLFGVHPGTTAQRLTMAVLGAAVVLVVGLLGHSVVGPRGGVVAAAAAAAYPNFWMPSGIVMSETLSMLLMGVILVALYRFMRRPTATMAVVVGAAVGLEILTREELVLLVPCMVLPAALVARTPSPRRRLALGALALGATVVVVAPWVGRNLATFEDPTFVSTGAGPVLLGANCPQTYAGASLGSWSLQCSVRVAPAKDQSVESARQRRAGIAFMEHHVSRLPVVVAARVGRLWDFYDPISMAHVDVNEGRPVPAGLAGLAVYYLLLPAAAAGIVVLRRRRVVQWPLLVPAGVLSAVAIVGYGLVRFRAPFEVSLVVLAAASVDAAWSWWQVRRNPSVGNQLAMEPPAGGPANSAQ